MAQYFVLSPRRTPAFPAPDALHPDRDGLVALGGELSPQIIVEAYTKGVFPWTGEHPIPWFSPDPRMILQPEQIRVTRSMRQVLNQRRFDIRFDTRFARVMELCASVPRPGQDGTWITSNMVTTWTRLHHLGLAHSVEAWVDNQIVGGLYGLALGRAFFGESMVALLPNASKAAFITLCRQLQTWGFHFIDCQQSTSHLASLGAVDIPRSQYLQRLRAALAHPHAWDSTP